MKTDIFARAILAISLVAAPATGLLVSAAHAGSDKPATEGKVTPDGQPIICRKVADTGSLVKKTKKCYTQAQWDRISEAARANGQRMQSDHASGIVSN